MPKREPNTKANWITSITLGLIAGLVVFIPLYKQNFTKMPGIGITVSLVGTIFFIAMIFYLIQVLTDNM